MSFSVPLHGRKSELALGSDLEIRIPALFKESFKVSKEDVAGWCHPPEERPKLEELPVWKRLPEIKELSSSQLRGKHNLALLFRRPLRLPALKQTGRQLLEVTRKQDREGVFVDGVVLQARDAAEAARLLRGWGITGFGSLSDAFTALVGIEEDREAVEQVKAERRASGRRMFLYTRAAAAMIIVMPAGRLIRDHTYIGRVEVAVGIVMSALFAALFAFVYRGMRFGGSAPPGGRKHRRVLIGMAPMVVLGLGGLILLKTSCRCSDVPLLVEAAAYWAPIAWVGGGMAAGFGFLGVKGPTIPI